jgi:hypothetical protein
MASAPAPGSSALLRWVGDRSIRMRVLALAALLGIATILVAGTAARGAGQVAELDAELARAVAVQDEVERARYDLLWGPEILARRFRHILAALPTKRHRTTPLNESGVAATD